MVDYGLIDLLSGDTSRGRCFFREAFLEVQRKPQNAVANLLQQSDKD
jgi:hypothetical protein